MKKKFKQWWSTIPPMSTNQTITSHLKPSSTKKKTMTYDVRNPGSGLKQANKCCVVKPFNETPTFPLLIIRSVPTTIYRYRQSICKICNSNSFKLFSLLCILKLHVLYYSDIRFEKYFRQHNFLTFLILYWIKC